MVAMMGSAAHAAALCTRCVRTKPSMGSPATEDVCWIAGSSYASLCGLLVTGSDAEFCTLRTEAVVSVPSDVDAAEYAPLLCAGVTTFNGIRQMNVQAGGLVAVQGLGGLGHLAVQYSRKMGFRTVALSSGGDKREFAHQLGATDYIDGSREDTAQALQKMGGAALVVVTAPNPDIIGPLLNGCAPLGKVLVLARKCCRFAMHHW